MQPAILLAAEATNLHVATKLYASLGFSVLPCTGKKPAITEWKHLQHRVALTPTIDLWYKVGLLANVGIICGAVSGNLVVIDTDGDKASWQYFEAFPHLLDTYTVRSGSGHGMHLYYYVRDLPPTTRVTGLETGNIELRANGCYVIAPPSIHPVSQKPYVVSDARPILFLDNMRPVVDWIKSLIREKHGGTMPPAANASAIKNATAYGRVALRNACDDMIRAQPGERNNLLYRLSLKMGSLIADHKIGRGEVERELLAAANALSETDGEGATRKTIISGIETGLKSPHSAWGKR